MASPEIAAAIHQMIAACARHGKVAGLGGDKDPQRQADYIAAGIRFVTTHTDAAFLSHAAAERVRGLRAAQRSVPA